jgi:hypothetical protein
LGKLNTLLASVAAFGLAISGPAAAATRAAQALPAASVQLDPGSVSRASAPLDDAASELGRRGSPAIILGLVALIALLVALAGGGGGGGNDSPG